MNEARNAIDLIIHAPEKVAEGYLSSLLASKAIQQFEKRHLEIREEAAPPEEAVPPSELDQKMAESRETAYEQQQASRSRSRKK